MRQILYAMHFRGQTSPSGEQQQVLHTAGSASSCVVRSLVRRSGLETEITAESGEFAFFESDLRAMGAEEFQEEGVICFGDENEHTLRFSTVGEGHMTPGPAPGLMAGSATWKVEGGEGQFSDARGLITTTFTLTDTGERCDYHCGLIFLPE